LYAYLLTDVILILIPIFITSQSLQVKCLGLIWNPNISFASHFKLYFSDFSTYRSD